MELADTSAWTNRGKDADVWDDFDAIAEVTGQRVRPIAPIGSL